MQGACGLIALKLTRVLARAFHAVRSAWLTGGRFTIHPSGWSNTAHNLQGACGALSSPTALII
jgi:hypothetical protein